MAIEVKIPQISENVETARITEILVSEGDTIEKDQSVIAVESDKASVEIPSSHSGKIKSIEVSEGDEVSVGDVILILEEGEEKEEKEEEQEEAKEEEEEEEKKEKDKEEEKTKKKEKDKKDKEEKEEDKKEEREEKKEKAKEEKDEEQQDEEEEEEKTEDKDGQEKAGGVPAAPGVRRLARELGVDINQVEGSGEGGRISKEDVKSHSKKETEKTPEKSRKSPGLPDFSEWGQTETKSLSGIRSATAKSVSASWQAIPHVFQFAEADISGIEDFMEKNKEKVSEAGGKLTITAILVKIAANALRQFPKFNASIDMENEEIILKKYVSIGIAVDTEAGLLVPVIRDADQKSITDIAVEIDKLAEKARAGELSSKEMKGGNFTISNLGGIGGTNFTPIINHPQVAILGVSRAATQPVYNGDSFEPREILPLSLSYDHRLIDGAEGVTFLDWIARALEDPYQALLG